MGNLITLAEASVLADVEEGTLYQWTEAGKIDSYVVGGLLMVNKEEVLDFIDNEGDEHE
jgi:excisionase family DNA binding protein